MQHVGLGPRKESTLMHFSRVDDVTYSTKVTPTQILILIFIIKYTPLPFSPGVECITYYTWHLPCEMSFSSCCILPVTAQHCHMLIRYCSPASQPLRCKQAYCPCTAASLDSAVAHNGTTDATMQHQFSHCINQQLQPGTAPRWTALQQKIVLAASAIGTSPILLLLDVAEQASLALFYLRQALLYLKQEHHQHPGRAQNMPHQQQEDKSHHSHTQAVRPSHATHSSQKRVMTHSSSTRHNRPFLDLWPPLLVLASATLPPILLAVRHCSHPAVLHLLLTFMLSMLAQAYLQLALALVATRAGEAEAAASKHAASTAAAAAARAGSVPSDESMATRWYYSAPAGNSHGSSLAGTSMALPEARNGKPDGVQQQQQLQEPQQQLGTSNPRLHYSLFQRLLPIVSDTLRLICLCYAAPPVLQQAVVTFAATAGCLSRNMATLSAATDPSHMLAIVPVAAINLHAFADALFWLMADGGLFAASIGVWTSAVIVRLLPTLSALGLL